jgi:hypothetical protein
MGISVPISTEHYKNLKEISDKLGLGLKKTVEHLVTYYWQREMSTPAEKIESTSTTNETDKEERYKELVASAFASTVSAKPTHNVPPSIISSMLNQPTASTPTKITSPASRIASTNCPSCSAPKRTNAKFCYNCGNLL